MTPDRSLYAKGSGEASTPGGETGPVGSVERHFVYATDALKELTEQTWLLTQIRKGAELDPCMLEQIGQIACLTSNEVHLNTVQLKDIGRSLEALVDMYRTVNPA